MKKIGALSLSLTVLASALVMAVVFLPARGTQALILTFVVNDAGDASDVNIGDNVCQTSQANHCTLRAAIEESNFDVATNGVNFDLGTSTPNIQVGASGLPDITAPIQINGNTGGADRIELDGINTGPGIPGLDILDTADASTVSHLVINRFTSNQMYLGADNSQITGNYIGTDATGLIAMPGTGEGIFLGGSGNTIGGVGSAARNVVSGNDDVGIGLAGSAALNQIIGNYIGVGSDGATPIGNGAEGIFLSSAVSNTITGNVISDNVWGIGLRGPATGNVIQGNMIGTDAGGTLDRGNQLEGIYLNGGLNNTIGGATANLGNTIAFNSTGVYVYTGSSGQAIFANSIHDNAELGIELNGNGVDTNDDKDVDLGANNTQNYPVLTSASSGGQTVDGTLDSTPGHTYTIYFFSNSACDNVSNNGEGQTFLGTKDVTTDAITGDASFSATGLGPAPGGQTVITALANDHSTGDSSEFSECVLTGGATPTPSPSPSPSPTPSGSATPTPTATAAPTPTGTAHTGTPTPTHTPNGSATPTPTGGFRLTQGDGDCDGDVDSVDGLKTLRHVAGLPVTQDEPCPDIGTPAAAADAAVFGDVDCDGDVDSVDGLKVLRHVAGLSVTQNEPCPDIGTPVS